MDANGNLKPYRASGHASQPMTIEELGDDGQQYPYLERENVMIDKDGVYLCDYCENESRTGEYYTETGNHASCQDKATLHKMLNQRDQEADALRSLLSDAMKALEPVAEQAKRFENNRAISYDEGIEIIGVFEELSRTAAELHARIKAELGE